MLMVHPTVSEQTTKLFNWHKVIWKLNPDILLLHKKMLRKYPQFLTFHHGLD